MGVTERPGPIRTATRNPIDFDNRNASISPMRFATYVKNHGQSEFARRLGVSQGLVWQWVNGRTRITAERAVQIESVTAGEITRHDLRPDLYPPQPEAA